MANRLTDTTIWKKQRWFKKLSPIHKLAWFYLTDACDHAGIWKIDMPEMLEDLGVEEFSLPEFIEACNTDFDKKTGAKISRERISEIDEDRIWLTGYLTFQYGGKTHKIKDNNHAVHSALDILKSLKLYDLGIEKGYFEIESSPSKPLKAPLSPLPNIEELPISLQGSKELDKDKEYILERLREIENVSISPPQENLFLMIVLKMFDVFKQSYPDYFFHKESDYSACLKIAYHIAEMKHWKKDSVLNGKMEDCVSEWQRILAIIKSDKWFSTRSLSDLASVKEWQRIVQVINHQKATNGATKQNFVAGRDNPHDKL